MPSLGLGVGVISGSPPLSESRAAFTSSYSTQFVSAAASRVECGDVTELNSVQQFSISSWSKHTVSALDGIWGKYTSGDDKIRLVTVYGDVTFYIHQTGLATASYGTHTAHTDDEWEHYVAVYDGTQGTWQDRIKLYRNGAALSLTYATPEIPSTISDLSGSDFYIGMEQGGHMEGYIDDVGLWDVALTAGAANVLYNDGTPPDLKDNYGDYQSADNLKGWWKMGDGDTHPTIIDHSGSGYNGTMVNMSSGSFVTEVPTQ